MCRVRAGADWKRPVRAHETVSISPGFPMSEWQTAEHAGAYLARADRVPNRTAGEAALLDEVPPAARRVLDLGSGDGRLLALVLQKRPSARGVALDFSPPMLGRLKQR